MKMKNPMKKSLLVILAVLIASISIFAQTQLVDKLYKNETEKKELVTAIMQDKELTNELMAKLMADMECCKDMMKTDKEGKKNGSMMGMMEMEEMKDCPMMGKGNNDASN